MKKTILITSGRTPAGLDLLRAFSRKGHRVLVTESYPVHLCQFSRFGRSFKVPSPSREPIEYVRRIREIVQQESVDLIIPMYEEIFPLSFFASQLGCELLADDYEKIRRLHSKFEFIECCREAGCSHPQTRLVSHADQIDDPENQVIKPVYSRFGTGVFLRPDKKTVDSMDFDEPQVLQEYVVGKPYCGFSLVSNGEIILRSVYPVETTLSGVCITFRNDPVPEIESWMDRFVRQMEFTGSIGFDFILKDREVFPVECNPRMTSGIHLFSGQHDVVDALLDRKPVSDVPKIRSMAGPFIFAKALLNWPLWRTWFSSKDVVFNWTDPFPAVGLGMVLGYLRLLAWRKGMPMSEVSSLDIEFNGANWKDDSVDGSYP